MSSTSSSFFVSELRLLWLLRIFVLSGWILRPTFSVLFLNSHNIFRSCSLDVANSSTSSTNQVREAVVIMVAQVYTHSFFLVPSLNFVLQRVLKDCVNQQARQWITLLCSFTDIENVALFVCLYRCLLVSVYLLQEADRIVTDVACKI